MAKPLGLMNTIPSFDLEYALQNYPVGQKRTRRKGQYVFLVDDIIVKGPYTDEHASVILERSAVMTSWTVPLIVHPTSTVYTTKHGLFLTFPNLAYGYPMETVQYTENFNNYENKTYNVLKRNTLVKLNDVFIELCQQPWFIKLLPQLMVSLICQYILNIGDIGLSNVLVDLDKQLLYCIDYEQDRSSDRDGHFFFLPKDMAKKKQIPWLAAVTPYYRNIYTIISQLLTRSDLTDVQQQRINLALSHLTQLINDNDQITVATTSTVASSSTIIIKITKGQVTNRGYMQCKGLRGGSIGYCGYPVDILKSAIQKYIRRGNFEKAMMAAIDMYRFAEFGTKGRPLQSNMYNRLAIIACEDVGPANLPLITAVVNLVNNDTRDPYSLTTVIYLMSQSKKTRIMSHYWRAYCTEEGKVYAQALGIDVVDELGMVDDIPNFWHESDPVIIRPIINRLYYRLAEQSELACVHVVALLKTVEENQLKLSHRRRRRTKVDILLWEVFRFFLPSIVVDVLEKAYFTISEKRPFLMTAIIAILKPSHDDNFVMYNLTPDINWWRANNSDYIDGMLKGFYYLEVDDYVVDMHTRKGRKEGKTRTEFVNDGAKVIPQCEYYYDSNLEQIYKES